MGRVRLLRPELPCLPPFWARGAHLQTLAAQYYPTALPALPWEAARLALEDGDALVLQLRPGRTGVAVLLFHGLGGSVEAHYMKRAAALFSGQGHAVIKVDHRGAGHGRGLAQGTSESCWWISDQHRGRGC